MPNVTETTIEIMQKKYNWCVMAMSRGWRTTRIWMETGGQKEEEHLANHVRRNYEDYKRTEQHREVQCQNREEWRKILKVGQWQPNIEKSVYKNIDFFKQFIFKSNNTQTLTLVTFLTLYLMVFTLYINYIHGCISARARACTHAVASKYKLLSLTK